MTHLHRQLAAKALRTRSCLIVDNSNISGHPVLPDFGPEPAEALELFLQETDELAVDRSREKFLVTFNPGGYLRKAGAAQT